MEKTPYRIEDGRQVYDVLIEDQEFVDKFCKPKEYTQEYFWEGDNKIYINKSLIGNAFLGCSSRNVRELQTVQGYVFSEKFVKRFLTPEKDPEYFV